LQSNSNREASRWRVQAPTREPTARHPCATAALAYQKQGIVAANARQHCCESALSKHHNFVVDKKKNVKAAHFFACFIQARWPKN